MEPAAGNSDVPGFARTVSLRVTLEIGVGHGCILVVRGGVVVFARVLYWTGAFERGRLPIAGGSAPEIHSVCALFSFRHCRLQTLAPAPGVARFLMARVSAALLRCVRAFFRRPADPSRMVHLLWHRLWRMSFPGVA